MHFTPIFLTAGLIISVHAALLPAILAPFEAKIQNHSHHSHHPTVPPFPTGTGTPQPLGSGPPLPIGTGLSTPPGTDAYSPFSKDLSRHHGKNSTHVHHDSRDVRPVNAIAVATHTRGHSPAPTGGYYPSSGAHGNSGGSAKPSGKGYGHGSSGEGSAKPSGHHSGGGGHGGVPTPTATGRRGSATDTSYAVYAKNAAPRARRGWFF